MARADARMPGWVEEARRRLLGRRCTRIEPHGPPRAGDLRLAVPAEGRGGEQRLVCILDVDRAAATVRAALTSNEVELATGADVLATTAATGLPFDLVVESDVIGTLCWTQVARPVGRLDRSTMESVCTALSSGQLTGDLQVPAVTVLSSDDARYAIKAEERERMRWLSAIDRPRSVPLVVDPILLRRPVGDGGESFQARLAAVAAEVATTADTLIPAAAVARLVDAWRRGAAVPVDVWRGLQPCLERTLVDAKPQLAAAVVFEPGRQPAPRWSERALSEACARQVDRGTTLIRLLTTRTAWQSPGETPCQPAIARLAGGGELRIIRHHVEVRP